MAHSSELECPQHGNMSIWATMHSEVESLFQLFIHDHSALQLTLSCDGIKNREHHMTGIPRYITADTLTPPPPIKRVAGCGGGGGRERERERKRKKESEKESESVRDLFGTISIPSELSPNPLGSLWSRSWPASATHDQTPQTWPPTLPTNNKWEALFLIQCIKDKIQYTQWERTELTI